jgi:hypothetical protein
MELQVIASVLPLESERNCNIYRVAPTQKGSKIDREKNQNHPVPETLSKKSMTQPRTYCNRSSSSRKEK